MTEENNEEKVTTINDLVDFRVMHYKRRVHDTMPLVMDALDKAGVTDPSVWEDDGSLGAFGNYHRIMMDYINNGEKPYLCIMYDDMILMPDFARYILERLADPVLYPGVHVLLTIQQDVPHELRNQLGWIEVSGHAHQWGGIWVIAKENAEAVVNHQIYQDHLKSGTNQQIDACVFSTMGALSIPIYMHNPSLCQHIGEESTLGHGELTENRKGWNYRMWGL